MSKIPKRGSKVTGYEGGRLPIHNIYGGSKSMEVSDICNLPTLHEVVSDRYTTTAVYISLFFYPIEVLMVPRVTDGVREGV